MAAPAIGPSGLTRRGVFVAAATAMLAAACGRSDDGGTGRGDSHELLIGVSLELTGSAAALGVAQERALQITLPSMNEEGVPVGNLRRMIRLIVHDNASNPKIAAQQAAELIGRDKVHALIGGTVAETSLAIIAVAEEEKVPYVSLAAADDIALPLSQRTFVYKLTPDARDVSRRLARLIASHKHKRVAILAAAGKHGDSGSRAVTSSLEAADLRLTTPEVVRLPRSGANFGSAARTVVDSNPEAVVIWATAPDSGLAARAVRKAGYDGPIYFDAGSVAEDTVSQANGDAVEGAHVVHPVSLGGSSLTNTSRAALARRDFVLRYVQEHGSFSGFAPYASDALQLLVTAARLAKSVDRGRLRVFMETQIAEGIAGSYAFTPINHGGMEPDSLAVFRASRGSWVPVS